MCRTDVAFFVDGGRRDVLGHWRKSDGSLGIGGSPLSYMVSKSGKEVAGGRKLVAHQLCMDYASRECCSSYR